MVNHKIFAKQSASQIIIPWIFHDWNKLASDKSTISNKFNEFYTNIGPNLAKEST